MPETATGGGGSVQVADETSVAHRAAEELRAAATLMADAQRVANFGSWERWMPEGTVTWSEQLFRIFGLDPQTHVATWDDLLERIAPEDRERVVEAIDRAVSGRTKFRLEYRIERPDGEERIVRCQGEPLIGPAGDVVRVVGVCQDVTELVRTQRARIEADMRFRSAFENAPIGIALVNFDDPRNPRFTEVNRALCELTEHRETELVGSSMSQFCHPEDVDIDMPMRERLLAGEIDRYTSQKRCVRGDGQISWMELNVSLVPDDGSGPPSGIVQVQDVTERKRAEEKLRYMADHDSLTGLLNRRRFREELDAQIALKRRYGGRGALLLLDVDRLKLINDTHGHAVGDAVLRRVGEVLAGRVRATDSVGRLAGDEFAILMPVAEEGEAEVLADSLAELLAEQRIGGQGIAISVGIAGFGEGDPERDSSAVLAAADDAMYSAKQRGGAGRQLARPLPSAPEDNGDHGRFPLDAESVREAIALDELLLYAQPVIDLRTGRVAHRELLVRMRGPQGEVLSAAEFLGAAAREPGLCEEIDRWVIHRAIAMLGNGARGQRLQVNLSGELLRDSAALDEILAEIGSGGIDPAALAFEIGESSIRRDVDRAEPTLKKLATAGCPVVLDGFSAAFGSFEYLQRLPLEQIKIDGSVVRQLQGEHPDHSTVRAIVRLASGSDQTTVAKLVDSEALIPLLRMHGVDMAQGFQIGEPAPLA